MAKFHEIFVRAAARTSAARGIEAAAAFGKNLILANLLGAKNQGIAATFAITVSFLEMFSDLGAGRLLVQADDGDSEEFQASVHAWEFVRGLGTAVATFLCAGWISKFFSAPEAEGAFQVLALIPLIKGVQHLDTVRFQRRLEFGKHMSVTVIPQVITAALAFPVVMVATDYWAALWLVLLQSIGSTLLSHLFADRRYAVCLTSAHAWRLASFGAPLILNGLLLFCTLYGDRAIIGRFYSPTDLGVFVVASALAVMASHLLMSVITPLALPTLSAVKDDPPSFQRRLTSLLGLTSIAAVAIGVAFVLCAPHVIRLIYSKEYAAAAEFVGILGIAAGLRTIRVVPNAAQMARAETSTVLYANCARTLGTGASLVCAMLEAPIAAIAWCAVFGEGVALSATVWFLRGLGSELAAPVRSVAASFGLAVGVAFWVSSITEMGTSSLRLVVFAACSTALITASVAVLQPAARHFVLPKLRGRRRSRDSKDKGVDSAMNVA